MSVRRLLIGSDTTDVLRALDEHPFEPIVETSPYSPPRATIDPDQSKGWLGRAWPVMMTHKGIWSLALAMSFLSLLAQVQIPLLIGDAISECLPTAGHTAHLRSLSSFAMWIFVSIGIREVANYLGRRCLLTTAYRF